MVCQAIATLWQLELTLRRGDRSPLGLDRPWKQK
jgi:hypothetical protein